MTVFKFRLGGPISLFLEAYSGDPLTVDTSTAKIRRLNHDRSDYLDDASAVAMDVTYQAAAAGQPAGWHVALDTTPSPQFKAGFYGIDAWLEIDGVQIPTEMITVHLRKAAGP
jgi:hypothetical protein